MSDHMQVLGHPNCLVFVTRDASGTPSQEYRTLFLQRAAQGAACSGSRCVVSAAHTDADIDHTIQAVADALPAYAKAVELGTASGLFDGRPVAPALRPRAAPRRRPVPAR